MRAILIGSVAAIIIALGLLTVSCSTGDVQGLIDDAQDSVTDDIVDVVTTTDTTTTTTQPPEPPALDPSVYVITKVTDFDITWTGPNVNWPLRAFTRSEVEADPMLRSIPASKRGDLCGESHLLRANGQGGKFDHIRRDTHWRDFKNIHSGYGVWSGLGEPANGERCELVLVSYDGSKRVTVGTFKWVR